MGPRETGRWPAYSFAIVAVALTAGIVYATSSGLSPMSRTCVLQAAVVVAALVGGLGPGLLATGAGLVAADLLLLPPRPAFPYHASDLSGLSLFLATGVLVSVVSSATRRAWRRECAHRLASEQRFRDLMEHAADAIFIADPEGVYTEVNEGACRLLGYPRDRLIGKRIVDIIPPRDVPRLHEFKAKLAGGAAHVSEWELVRGDGSTVPVELSAKVLPGGMCQAIVRDITARKQIEQDLIRAGMEAERLRQEAESARRAAEAAKEQAEAANRAKDQFLAVLSHELRTPLTPVVTGVHLLETDGACILSADARETVAMIRRNIDLETRLIDDLLDLTRVSRGKLRIEPTTVDVHAKLTNVIGMCEAEVKGKRLELDLALGARRHYARADPARLQQVFWNLLKNAIKFTPEGGRIVVRTADTPGGGLTIGFSDTGIGIDPDVLPRIFEAFEQGEKSVNRRYGGLGLGLAITKALVQLHGGTIAARSDGRDRGATFTIELPALDPPTLLADAPTDDRGEPRGVRPLSILVVEDHADTAIALERLLRGAGHVVRTSDCVATALAVADSEPFDLLISDIGLPDGSGLDLMRQLRARYALRERPIRGIVLSGFGMEEDVQKSREAGFAEHLTKPVNFARLRGTIEKIVAQ